MTNHNWFVGSVNKSQNVRPYLLCVRCYAHQRRLQEIKYNNKVLLQVRTSGQWPRLPQGNR